MNFASQLKKYREKAGFSQAKEFANELGIQYNKYIGYESKGSEPRYELLCTIANRLNVTVDELLGNTKDDYEYYKNLVESNRGFEVVEEDNKILIKRRYNEKIINDIKMKILENDLKDMITVEQVISDNKFIFDNKEEFINFVEEYDTYFSQQNKKCELWNNGLEEFYNDKELSDIVYKNIGVRMTADQIQRLSSATFCACVAPEESEDFTSKEKLAEYVKKYNSNYRGDANKNKQILFTAPYKFKRLLRGMR